ncbi:MAG: hypothetical protein ACREF3_17315 [Acetobacteraceae bacterium]
MQSRTAALAAILLMAGLGSARADIISPSPTYPPATGVFAGLGAGCFPTAGVCAGSGNLVITSVTSDVFGPGGQDFTADVVFNAPVTTLSGHSLGTLHMTGTLAVSLAGRVGPDDIGTWSTEIDSLDLGGTLLGVPLDVGLDTSTPSGGTTSITPAGNEFRIHSFFDVFVDLSLDSSPPLTARLGPLPVSLVPVAEPATLALLGLPLFGLIALHRRRFISPPRRM